MNCKKGDLAIIVRGDYCGHFVKCLRRYDGPWADGDPNEPGWTVEYQGSLPPFEHIADFGLRPIRDPGDDAVDQTLKRRPAPKRDKATA